MTAGELIFVMAVICAFIGLGIGSSKGHAGAGFILGGLLGFIGLIIIAVMQPAEGHGKPTRAPAPGGWWPDPYQRHEKRYFDGVAWTAYVSDGGVPSVESVTPS